MTRSELNEATARYLAGGGKVTKLPDGPDYRFQPYGIRVKPDAKVDLTVMEDPGSKKQIEAFEKGAV